MKHQIKRSSAIILLSFGLLVFDCSCKHFRNGGIKKQMIKDYYAAYERKDWSLMEPILADSFTFTSPAGDDRINLKAYKERCWPNALKTKKFDLEKIMVHGDDAYVTYNGWTTKGKLFRNTERFKFKDGKIIENECFFGTGVSFPNNADTSK